MSTFESAGWHLRERPLRLERRLEFAQYEATREFLGHTEVLSRETGVYPNMSFGPTYVNMTLYADEGVSEIGPEAKAFADRVDAMANANQVTAR